MRATTGVESADSDESVVAPNALADDSPGQAIWWEVAAVLAIGVVPHLASAIVRLLEPAWPISSRLDSFHLFVTSACIALAVLYIIQRSGEPWSAFGIDWPQTPDYLLGALISVAGCFVLIRASELIPADRPPLAWPPQSVADYAFIVIAQTANAFAEELVTRAYLITRLERLLQSPGKALAISTLLFTSYHVYYGFDAGLVAIALVGFGLGAVYLWLRRLWPLVMGHALINIILSFY
jgi:membrane protease YdiL (CAAX protease family)